MWQTRESEGLTEDVDRTGEACRGDWSGSSCLEPGWAIERLIVSRTSWHCRERKEGERRRHRVRGHWREAQWTELNSSYGVGWGSSKESTF